MCLFCACRRVLEQIIRGSTRDLFCYGYVWHPAEAAVSFFGSEFSGVGGCSQVSFLLVETHEVWHAHENFERRRRIGISFADHDQPGAQGSFDGSVRFAGWRVSSWLAWCISFPPALGRPGGPQQETWRGGDLRPERWQQSHAQMLAIHGRHDRWR